MDIYHSAEIGSILFLQGNRKKISKFKFQKFPNLITLNLINFIIWIYNSYFAAIAQENPELFVCNLIFAIRDFI